MKNEIKLKPGDVFCALTGERWEYTGKRFKNEVPRGKRKQNNILVFKPYPCRTYIECKMHRSGYRNFYYAVVIQRDKDAIMSESWFASNSNWIKEKYNTHEKT